MMYNQLLCIYVRMAQPTVAARVRAWHAGTRKPEAFFRRVSRLTLYVCLDISMSSIILKIKSVYFLPDPYQAGICDVMRETTNVERL